MKISCQAWLHIEIIVTSWAVDCDAKIISRPAHVQVDRGTLKEVDSVPLLLLLLPLDQALDIAGVTTLSHQNQDQGIKIRIKIQGLESKSWNKLFCCLWILDWVSPGKLTLFAQKRW